MPSLPFAELQLSNEDNKPVQLGAAGDVGRSMPTTTSTVTQSRVASRAVDRDTGRKESSARNFASRSGLDRLTACAARLRERVKRCAQFTFCVGCYETVVRRALSV